MSRLSQTIVALDQMSLEEIDLFLSNPINTLPTVKIGLELFVKHGSDLILKIHRQYNKKIFLDLKLHDIPITVERAIFSLKDLPIDFLTVHLSGGEEMLKACVSEARKSIPACKILGVSFLTSLEARDLNELFAIINLDEAFLRLFTIADRSGVDGVICSAHELSIVKNAFPKLLAITPGIRFSDEIAEQKTQDQKRVATPQSAFKLGADYIVIGRSLTKTLELRQRLKELENYL
ncbi:MAG: orotidine-5'-phosphate decarboxylase [Bacteriovorax sp.]|nr:orotidine-5'-phosphate decarboxylase [Bacteriovorax sp.]